MPNDDEIRALKRELVSSSMTDDRRKLVLAELAHRGEKGATPNVETRTAAKKVVAKKSDADKGE